MFYVNFSKEFPITNLFINKLCLCRLALFHKMVKTDQTCLVQKLKIADNQTVLSLKLIKTTEQSGINYVWPSLGIKTLWVVLFGLWDTVWLSLDVKTACGSVCYQ